MPTSNFWLKMELWHHQYDFGVEQKSQ